MIGEKDVQLSFALSRRIPAKESNKLDMERLSQFNQLYLLSPLASGSRNGRDAAWGLSQEKGRQQSKG